MLDRAVLETALAKVARRREQAPTEREDYTAAEVAALSVWMDLTLEHRGKLTRAEKRERNQAAWRSGNRVKWGGELRRRDPRRGWRNFGF